MQKRITPIFGLLIALCLCTAALHFILLGAKMPRPKSAPTIHKSVNPSFEFWISDYVRRHEQERPRPRARRLIYTTISAGLGNNLRGLLRAYAFAVLTRRVFVVRWERPYSLHTVLSENAMRRFAFNQLIDVPKGASIRQFHYMRMNKDQLYNTL